MLWIKLSKIPLIIFIFLLNPGNSFGFDYMVNDFTFYSIPNLPRPQKGVTFQDPTFHTNITRITNSATEGGNLISAGYPKHSAENADGTKLVVQSWTSPGWHIWNVNSPFTKIKDVPTAMLNDIDADCRWDGGNSDILYCHKGAILYSWNVTALGAIPVVVHDFTNAVSGETITSIQMREEGSPSSNSRYWAFVTTTSGIAYDSHILVYDKNTDSIVGRLDYGQGSYQMGEIYWTTGVWPRYTWNGNIRPSVNYVTMSHTGSYVMVGTGDNDVWIYARDFTTSRFLTGTNAHCAQALDNNSKDIVVCSIVDPIIGSNIDWASMWYMDTGAQYLLGPVGSFGGQHFDASSTNIPGWIVYSTYIPLTPDVPDEWHEHTVLAIEAKKLDNLAMPNPTDPSSHTKVWRIAHTHTKCAGSQWDAPMAKFNKLGTRVYFDSGWGTTKNDGQVDIYKVDLPATWYQDLTGNIPPIDTTPPATPTGLRITN